MVRLIYCMSKKDDLEMKEFRRIWKEEYEPLMKRGAELMGAQKIALSLTLAVEANMMFIENKGTGKPYDGVVELWWDNARDLMQKAMSPEGKAFREEVTGFERGFVDLSASTQFFIEA